jgi:hypothetical protein
MQHRYTILYTKNLTDYHVSPPSVYTLLFIPYPEIEGTFLINIHHI